MASKQPILTENETRAMHRYYLTSPDSPYAVAERYGVTTRTMYKAFARVGLTERRKAPRGQARRPQKGKPRRKLPGTPRACPGFSLFCPNCPSTPLCTDWHCNTCGLAKFCPCLLPKSKAWKAAYKKWQAK